MKLVVNKKAVRTKSFVFLALFGFLTFATPTPAFAAGFTFNQDTGVDPLTFESIFSYAQQLTSWFGTISNWIDEHLGSIKDRLQRRIERLADEAHRNGLSNYQRDAMHADIVALNGAGTASSMHGTGFSRKCAFAALRQNRDALKSYNASLERLIMQQASISEDFTNGSTTANTTKYPPDVIAYCNLVGQQFTLTGNSSLTAAQTSIGMGTATDICKNLPM